MITKYTQKYIQRYTIECAACGKTIFRDMAIYADGIQTCSDICAQDVLGYIAHFAKAGA